MDKNVCTSARPRRALAWLVLAALIATPALVGMVAAAATTKTVTMDGLSYSPDPIYVKPGDSVKWHNSDDPTHNISFENGSIDKDENVSPGADSSTYAFGSLGSFAYYCKIHGAPGAGMHSRVVVNSTGAPPPGPSPSPTATVTLSPTTNPTSTPKKTSTAKPSTPTSTPRPTVTATPTPTSTPTPIDTVTPEPEPTETIPSSTPLPTFAGGPTGSSGAGNGAAVAAIVVVALLGGAGYLIYRRFIASA